MSAYVCTEHGCPFQCNSERALATHKAEAARDQRKGYVPQTCLKCEHRLCTQRQWDQHDFYCKIYRQKKRERQSSRTTEEPGQPEEADLDMLNDLLGASTLNAPAHHELVISYPATDLLPPETSLYLEIPEDVQYREDPMDEYGHLDPTDLDYVTEFTVERTSHFAKVPASEEPSFPSRELKLSIDRLSKAPGTSLLEVIAYQHPGVENEVFYGVRLTTDWSLSDEWVREEKHIEFDWQFWDWLLKITKEDVWMKLLLDLITRRSVAACLHVRTRLSAYDEDFIYEHERTWTARWASDALKLPTAETLLCQRLQCYNDESGQVEQPATFEAILDEDVSVLLQCGHYRLLDVGDLRDAHPEEILSICCEVNGCDQKLFTCAEDVKQARRADDRWRRKNYLGQLLGLEEDTERFGNGDAFHLDLEKIPDALDEARWTMKITDPVIPHEVQVGHTRDVRNLAEDMRRYFTTDLQRMQQRGAMTKMKATLEYIYNQLRRVAFGMLYRTRRGPDNSEDKATPNMTLKIDRFVNIWTWNAALEALRSSEDIIGQLMEDVEFESVAGKVEEMEM